MPGQHDYGCLPRRSASIGLPPATEHNSNTLTRIEGLDYNH
jgi:hypothetical protein